MDTKQNSRIKQTEALQRLALTMLDSQRHAAFLQQPLLDMLTLFEEVQTPQAKRYLHTSNQTQTPNGLALAPETAANCAQDFVRTINFIRALHAAIIDIRSLFPGRPARILYAGCGPLAPLAIPLMTIFSEAEACFTLLDIHEESIESAKMIVGELSLTGSVEKFAVGDATSYTIDPNEPPDIIVLEIMQACLENEPQVAIARHFLRQAPDAILIPEEVNIELFLTDPSSEFAQTTITSLQDNTQHERIPLALVFTLSRRTIKAWQDVSTNQLTTAMVSIPEYKKQRYQLMLFTSLRIYKTHTLKAHDSGLTSPRLLTVDGDVEPGVTIGFHYELGAHPRLCGVVFN